jgi:hypothetical protein
MHGSIPKTGQFGYDRAIVRRKSKRETYENHSVVLGVIVGVGITQYVRNDERQ